MSRLPNARPGMSVRVKITTTILNVGTESSTIGLEIHAAPPQSTEALRMLLQQALRSLDEQ